MSINEFRNRITVKKYVFGQDDSGGNVKALTDSFDIWAKVENANGSRLLDNLQLTYSNAYKITTRFENSRQYSKLDEITFEDKIYIIQSCSQIEKGRERFNAILAYSTGTISNTGDIIYTISGMFDYTATGGETTVMSTRLLNKTILLVFRDGIQYMVITSGTAVNKKVLYDSTAGSLTFAATPVMAANESVAVYFIGSGISITGGNDGEVVNEVPAGAIDGINATYTTAFDFIPETVEVMLNGLTLEKPAHYNTSGNSTIIISDSPLTGDEILVNYDKL